MTLRKLAFYALAVPAIAGFVACNSSEELSVTAASSAAVKSFSLTKDDSVAAYLDSVYFSIDLVKGLIFNADSLPYGTDVTHLIPVITTLETASTVELKVRRSNASDTTYNYLENSTDSIDFTNPVTLRVISYDGLTERNYTIKINVHQMITDSLTWSPDNRSSLPTSFSSPSAQRTAQLGSEFFCLTESDGSYELATCHTSDALLNGPQLELDKWTVKKAGFPFTPSVESFTASESELFILDNQGNLYKSADGFSWDSTGVSWHYIYGSYQSQLLGSVETAEGWQIETYPGGVRTPLPDGMPVDGTSMPVTYSFSMSANPQLVFVGGRDSKGRLSRGTWSYDGNDWLEISRRSLPEGLEDIALAMYVSFKTLSSWNVITYPTLMAFGGRNADGKLSETVYISSDYGLNWNVASVLMQLPSYIPAMYGAQVFVADSYYSATVQPKISRPTESWGCPYLYMFGGYDDGAVLQNSIWRGAINRLTFVPIE